MPIQREDSDSMIVGESDLKPFIVGAYGNLFPAKASLIHEMELRQILQMLQRLSVLHPEQFFRRL
jgi:hypothetical protein